MFRHLMTPYTQFTHTPLPWVMGLGGWEGGGGAEPFFRMFKLAFQVGVIFFRWDLKFPCIKNSKYKSQAKKIILIVISTISHFWLTNLWQSVFVSLFSVLYTRPNPQIFFIVGGINFFFRILQLGPRNISNFLGTFCIWRS